MINADRRALYCERMRELRDGLPPHYHDPDWQLVEHAGFLHVNVPHIEQGGFKILEIGPGTGVGMLLMEELGNEVYGSDLGGDAEGEMRGWMLAYSKITKHLGLRVVYWGFEHYLSETQLPTQWPKFDLIYLRRSVSGVLCSYGRTRYAECTRKLITLWASMLNHKGQVFITHNSGQPQVEFASAVENYSGPLTVLSNNSIECRLIK